jgi:hypothetical protein
VVAADRGNLNRIVKELELAGRATHVPQAAVTSGIQRIVTVTPSRPVGWACTSDLDYLRD